MHEKDRETLCCKLVRSSTKFKRLQLVESLECGSKNANNSSLTLWLPFQFGIVISGLFHYVVSPGIFSCALNFSVGRLCEQSLLFWAVCIPSLISSLMCLRTVPTKYKGFCARLGPCGKRTSLQGLLESTKKNRGSHAFFRDN